MIRIKVSTGKSYYMLFRQFTYLYAYDKKQVSLHS